MVLPPDFKNHDDMFGKPQIDLTQIRPSSKVTLKLSCLAACGNDIEQAEKLYNFIAGDLAELPDMDIPKPSVIEQVKGGANDLFGWIGEHKNDIIDGWNFFQALRGKGGIASAIPAAPPADIPPIPKPE